MQVSLQLIPEQPTSELLSAIEIADELGYYACYSADEIYHKDAWLWRGRASAVALRQPTVCCPRRVVVRARNATVAQRRIRSARRGPRLERNETVADNGKFV